MHRRDFVATWAFPPLLTAALDRIQPARMPWSGNLEIGSEKQLLLDDERIAERRRISNFVYWPGKHPQNPILVADRPWETESDDGIELDTQATAFDEEAGLFKIWYLPAPSPAGGRLCCHLQVLPHQGSGSYLFGRYRGRTGDGGSSGAAFAVPSPTLSGCVEGRSVARFGRIDRSIEEPPCARRCRRTEARKKKASRWATRFQG